MSAPNYCPNCGEDLREHQNETKKSSSEKEDSEGKPTREDYRRILNEELEKAEAPDIAEGKETDSSENNLTREDYEEVLEEILQENIDTILTIEALLDELGLDEKRGVDKTFSHELAYVRAYLKMNTGEWDEDDLEDFTKTVEENPYSYM